MQEREREGGGSRGRAAAYRANGEGFHCVGLSPTLEIALYGVRRSIAA